ncbi:MAG: UDP-3-O-(3-hydroxymyristoyl)glucosamine N-acyltransferase [Bradyrhizobiaceae bacterium]|nr:UDP-3-O-(3-hydroxymyristoyl)glucosamine N-acyltransferase [Bradyrhizobiaceae bacterium]
MNSHSSPAFTLQEIAALVQGSVLGSADVSITGIQRLETALSNELSFLNSEAYLKFLPMSKAGAILVSRHVWEGAQSAAKVDVAAVATPLILVDDAYRAFVTVMQQFYPPLTMTPGLRHPSAVIHPLAVVHPSASIGPGCTVDAGCTIDAHAMLYANVSLYEHVHVGEHSVIHANVVCSTGTIIGKRCIIHPGAVLGADGFGFLENQDGSFDKIPQVGVVELADDVEVGANCTIDRAAVGKTYVGKGVKLDNLVHIAHGVTIGDNTAMAAQAGVSGSTTLGERNRIAGQVGIVGHMSTCADVVVEAQSGVSKSITSPGHYFGSPAKEHRTALRMEAALRQLPDLLREVRDLQRELAELKDKQP